MFVIAVDDDGMERNFLATEVSVQEVVLFATINRLQTIIPLSMVLDVVPVDECLIVSLR